jgi:hypothetical protein
MRSQSARGFKAIAYGENADDMQQVRPGRQAAAEFSVIAPLRDAGLTKAEIRELSRAARTCPRPMRRRSRASARASRTGHQSRSRRWPWLSVVKPSSEISVSRFSACGTSSMWQMRRVRECRIAPAEMSRLSAVESRAD